MLHCLWRLLIPDSLGRDRELMLLTNHVVGLDLAMLFWVPVFTTIYFMIGSPHCAAVVFAAGVGLVGTLLLLRHNQSPGGCGVMVTAVCWCTYTALACLNGGHGSPPTWWFATVPVLAFLLCSVRWERFQRHSNPIQRACGRS